MRAIWTDADIKKLTQLYPNNFTEDLCKIFNRTRVAIYGKANLLNLKKTDEHIKKSLVIEGEKLTISGKSSRFQKGHNTHNKGQKMSKELKNKISYTFFATGHLPHNTKYDGYERITKDGYREVRISQGKFQLLHRKNWIEKHGNIPNKHIIVFKDGNKLNCDISNLEMITMADNARRNRAHHYPEELKQVIKLKNRLINHINKKNEKQD